MELKDLLRKKRLEKGLTLQEVADAANVSASTISRYERGDISNIKPKTITALSKKLDIPVTNFINMTDDPKANEAITTAVSAAVKDVVKDKLSDLLLQQFMATREDRVSDVGIEDAITEALRMPGKQHIYSYPLYGDIACGEPIYADDHIQGYVETVRKIGADFCIKAKGDSMVGDRICDGDPLSPSLYDITCRNAHFKPFSAWYNAVTRSYISYTYLHDSYTGLGPWYFATVLFV